MINKTLIIVGPGGVGKGPLTGLIRDTAVSIDPYRMRPEGPRRESEDPLYVHPKLRGELHSALTVLGEIHVIILNPCNESLEEMTDDWTKLKMETEDNCRKRGESRNSIEKRVGTIFTEAKAWGKLAAEKGSIELTGWPFAEYRFNKEKKSELLLQAKRFIIKKAPQLKDFFKHDNELRKKTILPENMGNDVRESQNQ